VEKPVPCKNTPWMDTGIPSKAGTLSETRKTAVGWKTFLKKNDPEASTKLHTGMWVKEFSRGKETKRRSLLE